MIVTFKSAAAGDVIMFGEVAQQMMRLMGKDAGDTGIVTVEQLPAAIAGLRAAIEADKATRQTAQDDSDAPENRGMGTGVSLAQRAVPLLELLGWAQRKGKPVTWGV